MRLAADTDEIVAVRALVAEADKHQSDAERFSQLLTEDVVLVNFGGRRVLGRDNVLEAMRAALKTPFTNVYTRQEILDVRFPRRDVAIVSCVKHISDEREPAERDAQLAQRGNVTFVMGKEQGSWLIALAQTTPVVVD